MDRVFIVTSGSYSDYSIDSVWTTREAAEKAAGDYGTVEEWLLNEREERTIVLWESTIDPKGGIVVADKPFEVSGEVPTTKVWVPWSHRGFSHGTHVIEEKPPLGHGYGISPEHARKSLADALAKFKADRAGV